MGFAVPPLKPVIGGHQFLREGPGEISKIIAGGADADFAALGSGVAPSLTGAHFHWVWASHQSDTIIKDLSHALKIDLDPEQVEAVHKRIEATISKRTAYPK